MGRLATRILCNVLLSRKYFKRLANFHMESGPSKCVVGLPRDLLFHILSFDSKEPLIPLYHEIHSKSRAVKKRNDYPETGNRQRSLFRTGNHARSRQKSIHIISDEVSGLFLCQFISRSGHITFR